MSTLDSFTNKSLDFTFDISSSNILVFLKLFLNVWERFLLISTAEIMLQPASLNP